MDNVLHFVIVVAAVLSYYYGAVPIVGGYSSRRLLEVVTRRFGFAALYSTDEIDKAIRLSVAATLQVVFCVMLLYLSGVRLDALLPTAVRPVRIVYGILLGIGEAAMGSLLGELAMRTAMKVAPGSVPSLARDWLAMLKGGWMSLFIKTAESAPLGLVVSLALLYVAGEEIVFRGVLLNCFLPLGRGVAFLTSLVLFVTVQVFYMPSWEGALFPVVGALLIGTVHGLLYLAVPDLLPLIVAHLVFLLTVLL
jgi:Type II CAAX prenyl endopeptidase Rce1-like